MIVEANRRLVPALVAGVLASTGCTEFMWPKDDQDVARCRPSQRAAFARHEVDAAATERITAGSTDVTSTFGAIRVQGSGESFVGNIDLVSAGGTIDLGCKSTALATLMTDDRFVWALAVGEHALYPLAFNCTIDGELEWVRYVSTEGADVTWERASGRCQLDFSRDISKEVRLPAIDMPVPGPLVGYTIDGPSIHLPSGAEGTILADGVEHRLLAFNAIDCGPDCPTARWHELDALIWLPSLRSVSYATLLLNQPGDPVRVTYLIAFPGFRDGLARTEEFPATFSTP